MIKTSKKQVPRVARHLPDEALLDVVVIAVVVVGTMAVLGAKPRPTVRLGHCRDRGGQTYE